MDEATKPVMQISISFSKEAFEWLLLQVINEDTGDMVIIISIVYLSFGDIRVVVTLEYNCNTPSAISIDATLDTFSEEEKNIL